MKKSRLVPDVNNFWKWWSVQLGLLSGAFAAAAVVYGSSAAIHPSLVSGFPEWFGVGLTGGSMFCAFAGVWVRRWRQGNLKEDCDVLDNSEKHS